MFSIMATVDSILKDVYGEEAQAAVHLGVVRSAISNWKAWGHFPAHVLPKIVADANASGVTLDVADIPIMTRRPPKKRASA